MLSANRAVIFWLEMAYLGALALLAILFFSGDISPRETIGTVPTAVPWFGALGGVLISLKGVFDHPYDWSSGYRLWHISRPFVSAALAVIAVIMFQSGIVAVGSTLEQPDDPATATNLFYYLIAFLVGYREETFRELIKRLVDVILSPGPPPGAAPSVHSLDPDHGPISGETRVTITGIGLMGTRSVKFGSADANFTCHNDSRVIAIAPQTDEPGPVAVTVTGPAGSDTASFTYQGSLSQPPSDA